MPCVLSKPLAFTSCHYNNNLGSEFYQYPDDPGNFHFWVEQGHHIIDPTDLAPHPLSNKRIYIPFTEEQQKAVYNRLLLDWTTKNEIPEEHHHIAWTTHLQHLYNTNDYSLNGQCFRNASALKYHLPNSKLVCGMFGHKLLKGRVDVDYGW